MVNGLKAGGPVVITASYGGLSATKEVTVNTALLNSLKIDEPPKSIAAGADAQLVLFGTYSDLRQIDVAGQAKWSISDPSVVTISKGLVKGLKPGRVTIPATLEQMECPPIELEVTNALLQSLCITPVEPAFFEGELRSDIIEVPRSVAATLKVTGYYSDSSAKDHTKDVTWTSANDLIARFDAANPNRLVGIQAGRTEIAASFNGQTKTVPVVVFNSIERERSVVLTPSSPRRAVRDRHCRASERRPGLKIRHSHEGNSCGALGSAGECTASPELRFKGRPKRGGLFAPRERELQATSTPVQLDPSPAVQQKQCSASCSSLPVRTASSRSSTVRGVPSLSVIGRSRA